MDAGGNLHSEVCGVQRVIGLGLRMGVPDLFTVAFPLAIVR